LELKEGFRQCMAWLHTWTGLVVGWVLFFVFATGTVGYFYAELDRWMRPELPIPVAAPGSITQLQSAENFLQRRASNADEWSINFAGSERTRPDLLVLWRNAAAAGERANEKFQRATLDPATGTEIKRDEVRKTGGGFLLYRMHYSLHYIPYDFAFRLIGVCTMLMLVAIVSGIITHKKIFKDFFTFRPAKGQRSWLDAHDVISVMALPFFLMITYSGLVFFLFQYMPAGVLATYGTDQETFVDELYERGGDARQGAASLLPLQTFAGYAQERWGSDQIANMQVRHRGAENAVVTVRRRDDAGIQGPDVLRFDGVLGKLLGEGQGRAAQKTSATQRTYGSLLSLHEGHFAGIWLRWGYFLSGLLGCVMIATGLVLWTVKRRAKQDLLMREGQKMEWGFRLVECLNIGTIVGLPAAIAVYLWANRLLPAGWAARADWEVHAMFITWGLAVIYPALRVPSRAWVHELLIAAALFLLLPLVNTLTTHRDLSTSIAIGDWALAGVDLTAFALGVLFALAAQKMRRRLNPLSYSDQRHLRRGNAVIKTVGI
jgi:uncharacterized iron-regulated membrane protein